MSNEIALIKNPAELVSLLKKKEGYKLFKFILLMSAVSNKKSFIKFAFPLVNHLYIHKIKARQKSIGLTQNGVFKLTHFCFKNLFNYYNV